MSRNKLQRKLNECQETQRSLISKHIPMDKK